MLSSTSVYDLRKKNETKNNTGVKLLVRHKNKYESKPLITDPRELRHYDKSSDELNSEEGEEERDDSAGSFSEEEMNEKDSDKQYYR
jgi:hypothetical protein